MITNGMTFVGDGIMSFAIGNATAESKQARRASRLLALNTDDDGGSCLSACGAPGELGSAGAPEEQRTRPVG